MTAAHDLERALQHLRAAQRLLRGIYALRAIAPVNKAIAVCEDLLRRGRPAQPPLAFEAPDQPTV
jgi:hypothetical protein